ncbi:MAG: hypothetical protein NUW37_00060 [Planctomycetes bacterium]|nr:hypothetical protein [Planctomycetota bacterium]
MASADEDVRGPGRTSTFKVERKVKLLIDEVDSEELGIGVEPDSDFGPVIDQLRKLLSENGRLIEGCTVDGQPLTPNLEFRLRRVKVADIGDVNIVTNTPTGLARLVLTSLDRNFEKFGEALVRTAELLQTGKGVDAAKLLAQFLGEVYETIEAVQSASQLLGVDLGSLEISGGTVESSAKELAILLEQTQEAIASADHVTISDILEYELAPSLENWHEIIRVLLDKSSQ